VNTREFLTVEPLVQKESIDVAEWNVDAEFGVFPQGARAKDAVISPAVPGGSFLVPNKRYLFKRSKRSYPDQFWGEVVAYRVGCLMGLKVPPAFAAYNSRTGYCAALIEWFYRDGAELFVHGGDFMQRLREGFDRDKGTQHNLHDIERLMRALVANKAMTENWRQWWLEALLFDALIGNSDRHQDNWGLIFETKPRESETMPPCRLAPLFDNGTSLGHERFPERVANWPANRVEAYIAKGTHHVKFALDGAPMINGHMTLLSTALQSWRHMIDLDLLRSRVDFSSDSLTSCFADLSRLQMPVPLSPERISWMERLLVRRHTLLTTFLNATA
jgi:hypothetical protein